MPYLLIVGDKEVEKNSISVRARGSEDLGTMSLDRFTSMLRKEVEHKK